MAGPPPQIFDRKLVRQRRERTAQKGLKHILGEIVAEEILDRLSLIKRDFKTALVAGPLPKLADAIAASVEFCVEGDLALSGATSPHRPFGPPPPQAGEEEVSASQRTIFPPPQSGGGGPSAKRDEPVGGRVIADDEALPFAEGAFDLIISALSLHWVSDLPGALIQIRHSLQPDGLFMAALLGGETLHELRASLSEAEVEIYGGLSPRFSPTIDLRDMGALLQRAGFALPVVDTDKFAMRFETPLELIAALRDSGETNALRKRSRPVSRGLLARMLETYASRFAHRDGGIRATFEVIYLTAWSPHESQQKPLAPGSARIRLSEALRTQEQAAGEKAAPQKR
jgi:SAM-dependent methyltransferase